MSLTPVLQHSSRSRRPTNQSSAALTYSVATKSFFFFGSLTLSVCVLRYLSPCKAPCQFKQKMSCWSVASLQRHALPLEDGESHFHANNVYDHPKVLNFSIISLTSLLYIASDNVYRSSPELGFYNSILIDKIPSIAHPPTSCKPCSLSLDQGNRMPFNFTYFSSRVSGSSRPIYLPFRRFGLQPWSS